MNEFDIIRQRLHNQHLNLSGFQTPGEVVGWLGAVQAQDFSGAKWAVGLRMQSTTDGEIERAFNQGDILRTHLLRPTWHFVLPQDIRWMLALTAPRVHAVNAFMYRKLGLNDAIFQSVNEVIRTALRGGNELTRGELRSAVEQARIAAGEGLRLLYILMNAELNGIICSGARRGKQFTYALLDERAPQTQIIDKEGALSELTRRFFYSRGPAVVHDFAKWSGLPVSEARLGVEMVKAQLHQENVDGQVYWGPPGIESIQIKSPTAYLLSVYDEFFSGYKKWEAFNNASTYDRLTALGNDLSYIILIDGQIAGTWKRTVTRNQVEIRTNPFRQLTQAETQAITRAAERYGQFHQLPVSLV